MVNSKPNPEVLLKNFKNTLLSPLFPPPDPTKIIFFGTFSKKCAKILASYQINAYICTQKRDSA